MGVTVRPARADERPRLWVLLAEYLVELSRYGEVDRSYPWFDAYWKPGEARWPYVIENGTHTIGLALVNTHAPDGMVADYAMAEFYIVPSARRLGWGHRAAAATFRQHPGRWALSVMSSNAAARHFWPAAIAASGAREIEQVTVSDGVAFRFQIAATG
jgi:predicted acetyltransferase